MNRRGIALLPLAGLLLIVACGPGGAPSGAPAAGAADAGRQLFASKGCVTCHTLAAVEGATGTIGPKLDGIATTAATRKSGMAADVYIRESIADPNAFVAPGFSAPSPMPSGLASGKELDDLVAFLLTQK